MSDWARNPVLFVCGLVAWLSVTGIFFIGMVGGHKHRPRSRVLSGVALLALMTALVLSPMWLHSDAPTRCEHAGGVLVNPENGPSVCIDRHAVIPDRKWRR